MTRHRHSDECRVSFSTPTKARCQVEAYRRRATRRQLLLLECAIIRHAPFADCGRPLWELMADQPWFRTTLPPAERIRIIREHRGLPLPEGSGHWPLLPVDGHMAVEWVEKYADAPADDDALVLAEDYFRYAEWSAEAGRFATPDDRRDELELCYGVASWLYELGWTLRTDEVRLWNIIDYYLAAYPAEFYRWAGWRPLHPGHRAVAMGLIADILGPPLGCPQLDPGWRTPPVLAIAEGAYADRAFDRLPVLADALEDAGCDQPVVLNHCRNPGVHVRGCWVIDQVIGRAG